MVLYCQVVSSESSSDCFMGSAGGWWWFQHLASPGCEVEEATRLVVATECLVADTDDHIVIRLSGRFKLYITSKTPSKLRMQQLQLHEIFSIIMMMPAYEAIQTSVTLIKR